MAADRRIDECSSRMSALTGLAILVGCALSWVVSVVAFVGLRRRTWPPEISAVNPVAALVLSHFVRSLRSPWFPGLVAFSVAVLAADPQPFVAIAIAIGVAAWWISIAIEHPDDHRDAAPVPLPWLFWLYASYCATAMAAGLAIDLAVF